MAAVVTKIICTPGLPSHSRRPMVTPSGNHNHCPNTSTLGVTRIQDSVKRPLQRHKMLYAQGH